MNTITTRPHLDEKELLGIRRALRLRLRETASEEAIAREWARHWWDNHAMRFKHGLPEEAIPEVPMKKLADIAWFYERDYRDLLDRWE